MELGVSSLIGSKRKSNSNPPIQMVVLPEELDVSASQNQTILDALLAAEVEIDHSCGGMGSCGTCRVFVEAGLELLGPRGEIEEEIARDRQFEANERLCCQNLAQSGLRIRKPY